MGIEHRGGERCPAGLCRPEAGGLWLHLIPPQEESPQSPGNSAPGLQSSMVAEGGCGQGASAAGRGDDLTRTICCGQEGCMAGGVWEKEAGAPGLPGWPCLGIPISCTSTPALPPAPASSSPVPQGHSLTTPLAVSNLLTSASDVPSAPEECSVYLFFT